MSGRKEQAVHGLLSTFIYGGMGRLSEWAGRDVRAARGRSPRTFLSLAGTGYAGFEVPQVLDVFSHPHVNFTSQRPHQVTVPPDNTLSTSHVCAQRQAEVIRGQLAGACRAWEPSLGV